MSKQIIRSLSYLRHNVKSLRIQPHSVKTTRRTIFTKPEFVFKRGYATNATNATNTTIITSPTKSYIDELKSLVATNGITTLNPSKYNILLYTLVNNDNESFEYISDYIKSVIVSVIDRTDLYICHKELELLSETTISVFKLCEPEAITKFGGKFGHCFKNVLLLQIITNTSPILSSFLGLSAKINNFNHLRAMYENAEANFPKLVRFVVKKNEPDINIKNYKINDFLPLTIKFQMWNIYKQLLTTNTELTYPVYFESLKLLHQENNVEYIELFNKYVSPDLRIEPSVIYKDLKEISDVELQKKVFHNLLQIVGESDMKNIIDDTNDSIYARVARQYMHFTPYLTAHHLIMNLSKQDDVTFVTNMLQVLVKFYKQDNVYLNKIHMSLSLSKNPTELLKIYDDISK